MQRSTLKRGAQTPNCLLVNRRELSVYWEADDFHLYRRFCGKCLYGCTPESGLLCLKVTVGHGRIGAALELHAIKAVADVLCH